MDPQKFWNERYGQPDYAYGTAPNDFLESILQYFPEKGRVLCLGEGEGRNGVFLARQGLAVSAVDISSAGKEKAEKLAAEHGVSLNYTVANVNDYDFGENRWDSIVSIFAHTDPATRQRTLIKVREGLKENGIFVLEGYHPKQRALNYETGGPKDIAWLVTLEELQNVFQEWEILHRAEMERAVHEGPHHSGKAFVTQFICRKYGTAE